VASPNLRCFIRYITKNKRRSAVTMPTRRPPNMPASRAGLFIKPLSENMLLSVDVVLEGVAGPGCGTRIKSKI